MKKSLARSEKHSRTDKRLQQNAIDLLRHRDSDRRIAAIDALAASSTQEALGLIMKAFLDRSWKVRMRAAERAAPLLSGQKAPRQFMRLLRDPHELVRVQAVESLADLGDARVIRQLKRSLSDASPLVRSFAASTIGALGTTEDKKILQRRLKNELDDTARLGLLAALYSLNDDQALDGLINLLESNDFEVRSGSAATLVRSVAEQKNVNQIRAAVQAALQRETTVNARHHLRRLTKELDSRFPPRKKL